MRVFPTRRFSYPAVLISSLVLALVPAWARQADTSEQRADLSRLVVLGDSLSAGFQNFSLYYSDKVAPPGGQTHGFAALIAHQAKVSLNLPLIKYPGIPPVLTLQPNGEVTRAPGYGSRESPGQTLNLSVPGFDVIDVLVHSVNLLTLTPADFEDVLAVEILDPSLLTPKPSLACGVKPGTKQGEVLFSTALCAIELRPTTILVSAGSGDALQSLTLGVPPTDVKKFEEAYEILLDGLSDHTHAKIVVSNVPDVADVPFLVSYPEFVARCGAAPIGAGLKDYVVPNLALPTFDICTNYVVRSASLIAQAETAVREYNAIIKRAAAKFGVVVVDVNELFADLTRCGYNVAGHHLTTQYLGGIFSLDAIHPTNTGYAILANAFIDRMNCELHTDIPRVNIDEVAEHDPLVF